MLQSIEQELMNRAESMRIRSAESIFQSSCFSIKTPNCINSAISSRLKGMILCSLIQKRPNITKMSFFKWYAKIQNKKHQSILSNLLTGRNRKISKDCIVYRLKQFARILNQVQKISIEKQVKSNTLLSIIQNTEKQVTKQITNSIEQYRSGKFKQSHKKQISGFSNASENNQCNIERMKQKKGTSRSIFGSNTIASLKSIIDQKVLKKKSNFLTKHKNNENIQCNAYSNNSITSSTNFQDLFQNQENLNRYEKIQKNLNVLMTRKSSKIIYTLKIVKQVSTIYLQSCIIRRIRKRKGQVFNVLKVLSIQLRKELQNDYDKVQRQLQLVNQNLQKEQQLQQLAQQLQERVQQIQQIQQEMVVMNSRMTKVFLEILVTRLTKIFNKRIRPRFIELCIKGVSQMNILPQYSDNSQGFLQTSGIYAKVHGTMICDYSDLNSVKKIIGDDQQNQHTYETTEIENFYDFE